jgi:UDP-glucose 4-epimerase
MELKDVKLNFGDSDRGWKGDVPIVRLNSVKIRNLGWTNKFSAKEAIHESVSAMYNKINNI